MSASKRSKLSKGHTGRQLGDPEMTEPDSEDDSLFGDAELSVEDLKLPPIGISFALSVQHVLVFDKAVLARLLAALTPRLPHAEREATKEALTADELVARRLKHAKQLYSLYKVEYWGLLEELRTRHKRFVQKQAKGGPGTSPTLPTACAPQIYEQHSLVCVDTRTHDEPSERIVGSLREEIRRKAEHPANDSAGIRVPSSQCTNS